MRPHGAANPSLRDMPDTPANRALFPEPTPQDSFDLLGLAAYRSDSTAIVLRDDVREGLRRVARAGVQVDCIVTSPPFYGQRDYGYEDQIGLEAHPSEYLANLLEVFTLCREVLKPTGSLWVNLGDTYWSGKGEHKSGEAKQGARRFGKRPQDATGDGYWAKPKQLLLIPHRFAALMQGAGWLVRNDNVWVKPKPVPDQVRDRCSISHEYMFHFTKERWYYFDKRQVGTLSSSGKTFLPPRDTWEVDTARTANSRHRAAFSEGLLRIPVLATTPADGVVLDPFAGSGTSLAYASRNGFRAIGIDASSDYCDETWDRLQATRAELKEASLRSSDVRRISEEIAELKAEIESLTAQARKLEAERVRIELADQGPSENGRP